MPIMYGYNWSWGSMLLMMLSWVVGFVLLGLLLWALFRWLGARGSSQTTNAGVSAHEILRQRYARGEIDEATYERMRQQLEDPVAHDTVSSLPDR